MDAGDKVDISNFYLILHFALKRIIFDMGGCNQHDQCLQSC